ncbi:MAG: VOC family protein [Dehalococcoidia bacterium]|nr:VOC family protein [Dehalococcoidia bacterium]
MSSKFGTAKVSQIGVVVKDRDKTIEYFSKVLGIGPWSTLDSTYEKDEVMTGQGRFTLKVAFADLGGLEIELIEVGEGHPIHADFLKAHGEGLHHVAYDVTDLKQRVADLEKQGVKPLQYAIKKDGDRGHAYLATDKVGGVVVELVQRSTKSAFRTPGR